MLNRITNDHFRCEITQFYPQSVKTNNQILGKLAAQPEVLLVRAQTLDASTDQQKSNPLLLDAVTSYVRYLEAAHRVFNHSEYRQTAEQCIKRMRFLGKPLQRIPIY